MPAMKDFVATSGEVKEKITEIRIQQLSALSPLFLHFCSLYTHTTFPYTKTCNFFFLHRNFVVFHTIVVAFYGLQLLYISDVES